MQDEGNSSFAILQPVTLSACATDSANHGLRGYSIPVEDYKLNPAAKKKE
ncbi:hypothetical protein EMGR_004928 [Emarellia grisea]